MRIKKVAVLPLGLRNPRFQEYLNRMIQELFTEGWELERVILSGEIVSGERTLVIFSKEKEKPEAENVS